jgi:hypothetical protein
MSQRELLIHTCSALERASIPYMITGSTVSSMQGQPRTTHDIDIVITIRPTHVAALVSAFPSPRFYLDEDSIRDAMKHGGMFNALDNEGGDKVDFWILKPDPFDQSMFRRRYKEIFAGQEIFISQPEDTILSKLRWARECGGSEKQMRDCRAVFEVNYENMDMDYLQEWSRDLGVLDLFEKIRADAQI